MVYYTYTTYKTMKHIMFKNNKGFTLIELLVVIAIIGILAAMVITNLRTARQKARDASAITSLSSMRAEAENYYDENSYAYTGLCNDSKITPLLTSIQNNTNVAPTCTVGGSGDQDYVAFFKLVAVGEYFCVDSTGFAGRVGANPPAGMVCQ